MSPKSNGQPLDARDLAIERSRMSAERTLMSWIRTSLSMIGVGFTIYKFFQYIKVFGSSGDIDPRGVFYLGATLVIVGTFFLIPATLQHMAYLRHLLQEAEGKFPISWAQIAAIVSTLIGLGAIANILFQWGPF